MTDLRKAAEMALKQLQRDVVYLGHRSKTRAGAINALRQALDVDAVNMTPERVHKTDKFVHEPLCYLRDDIDRPFGGFEHCDKDDAGAFPVYTAPPKKEWVGLTDEEINTVGQDVWVGWPSYDEEFTEIYRLLEAKLKEKNDG